MARKSTLSYDRGTLLLYPPPKGKSWIEFATWDDRVEKFRIPAHQYRFLLEKLLTENIEIEDKAKDFLPLELVSTLEMVPYPHQSEALQAWKQAQRQGVVVLPTAAGKTYLAQLAMQATPRSTLVIVPTLDLMHQWYAHLVAAFPDSEIGLLGGGSRDKTPILVATYDSAAIHAEALGNKYALLVFDECHHLPTDFNRVIAEYSIAPYRLGLSATPERTDGKHSELQTLIGPEVYRKSIAELAGGTLADYEIVQIKVKLSQIERQKYNQLIDSRNEFLKQQKISLGSLKGWQLFVQTSCRSPTGRRAMLAHRQAREIALGTSGKIRLLADILCQHHPEKTIIFTADNATVYRISEEFLIPAITHQTPVKERHEILSKFKAGDYQAIIASHVLNEGVDVPNATIAILLSGTGSQREYIQRLGRILRTGNDKNKRAILYEIIAEDTTEENTSNRRQPHNNTTPEKIQPTPIYSARKNYHKRAAEKPQKWLETPPDEPIE